MSTSAGVYENLLPACSPEFRISFLLQLYNKLWRYFHPHHEWFFDNVVKKNKHIFVRQCHGASIERSKSDHG